MQVEAMMVVCLPSSFVPACHGRGRHETVAYCSLIVRAPLLLLKQHCRSVSSSISMLLPDIILCKRMPSLHVSKKKENFIAESFAMT